MSKLKKSLIAIIGIAILAFPLLAMAQGKGDRGKMKGRMGDRFSAALKLSAEQEQLFEKSREAQREFFELKVDARRNNEKGKRGFRKKGMHGMRGLHRAFGIEMRQEKPDFAQVAAELKTEYQGNHPDAFANMVDAMADFHQSLSVEQRERMEDMMKRHRDHKRGGKKGKPDMNLEE